MKKVISLTTVLSMTILLACNMQKNKLKACNGASYIIHYNGVDIISQPILKNNITSGYQFRIEPTSETIDTSPKDCDISNLSMELFYAETINTGDLKIHCNRDYYYKMDTIVAGDNFLERRDLFYSELINSSSGFFYGIVMIDGDSSTIKGSYIFYISGKTSLDNSFIDSTTIVFN